MDKKKEQKTALEAAYAYLANRMRTRAEVKKHLKEKGYSSDEADDALMELESMRYIDDHQYALRYYECNREKKRGVLRAERELIEKGVSREAARNAKEDFLYENNVDEYSDALEIARREVFGPDDMSGGGGSAKELDDRLKAKIARKLESKGYEKGDIFRVLDALRRSLEEE